MGSSNEKPTQKTLADAKWDEVAKRVNAVDYNSSSHWNPEYMPLAGYPPTTLRERWLATAQMLRFANCIAVKTTPQMTNHELHIKSVQSIVKHLQNGRPGRALQKMSDLKESLPSADVPVFKSTVVNIGDQVETNFHFWQKMIPKIGATQPRAEVKAKITKGDGSTDYRLEWHGTHGTVTEDVSHSDLSNVFKQAQIWSCFQQLYKSSPYSQIKTTQDVRDHKLRMLFGESESWITDTATTIATKSLEE
jgi:hypothetical protein